MSNEAGYFHAFGPFCLDLRKRVLLRDGQPVALAPKTIDILVALVEDAGNLVEKAELMQRVWPDAFVEEANLSKNIYALRNLLGRGADGREYIETVPKRGYRFVAEVRELPAPRPRPMAGGNGAPGQAATAVAPGEASSTEPLATAGPTLGPRLEQARQPFVDGTSELRKPSVRWRRWAVGLAAAIAALGIAFALYLLSGPVPAPEVAAFNRVTDDGRQKLVSVELGSPILTDGLRLYFMEWRGGRAVPAEVSVEGGDVAPIDAPAPLSQLAAISPDHSELLIAGFTATEADAPLWIIPIPGGTPRRLGDLIGHDGTWSPDGSRLLYAKGSSLYIAQPDGSNSHRLVEVGGMAYWPRWSPDGRVLRFTVNDPKTDSDSLWEVSADGTGLRPLFPTADAPPDACCGNWTTDGSYYVFEASDGGKTNIWTLREKRSLFHEVRPEPKPLTDGPMNFAGPVSGLNGKQLFAIGSDRHGELVRYDSKSKRFAAYLSGISVEGAYFSRDQEWAAYSTYPEMTLWRSRVDGTERLQLTFPPMLAVLPRWSPDGKRIAFMGQLPDQPWKIYTTSVNGGAPEPLLPGQQDEADPNWSPDGNSLVFGGAPWAGGGKPSATAIEIVDLKTHRVSTVPGSEGLYSPRWSPTGCCLVALPADSHKLVLYDFSTGRWEDLVNLPADFPAWSRTGEYVYFGHPGSEPSIMRVRVRDRVIERVADLSHVRRAFGVFGPWFGLGPDDSPLLVKGTGREEIYALDVRFR